tara:strand:+ start:920 stop:1690 length:771 start_codon:yes stop_codon:yes gene_type:complete
MLALVSPAKKLDFTETISPIIFSQPVFLERSAILVEQAKKLSQSELARLMKLSDKLTDLNYHRFRAFSPPFTLSNAKQAVLAFRGDTYVGLDATSLSEDDLVYAQDHLRILSGLYGILRPLDLIQPYRLEMGSRLPNPEGNDLYEFWGDDIAHAIDTSLETHKEPVVINLASNEYFKAARSNVINKRVITPVFKEVKNGISKVLGIFAKRARGSMARYIIRNRIEDPENLKKFTSDGYAYQEDMSSEDTWIFTRRR